MLVLRPRTLPIPALLIALACAVSAATGSQAVGQGRFDVGRVTPETRWAFRAISPATVSTPIVRLEDVVQPLDPNLAGWPRLRREMIGLVPVDGTPMTLDRDRLAQAIRNAEATPASFDWVGPQRIVVQHVKHRNSDLANHATPTQRRWRPYPFSDGRPESPVPDPNAIAPVSANVTSPSLSAAEATSVLRWIENSFHKQHSEISDSYEISIDPKQSQLIPLKMMLVPPTLEMLAEPAEGVLHCRVSGHNVSGPCQSVVEVRLKKHPLAVFPRSTIPRGRRLTARDLIEKPIPAAKRSESMVDDLHSLVGLEVKSMLPEGRPIKIEQVGPPLLVRRGDLLDLRVSGGGVQVTTRAKALDDGAESDVIQVETLAPKKRLQVRVVQSGLVEIVTRAPRALR